MGQARPRHLTLDTGALVALEKGDRRLRALLRIVVEASVPTFVPAGVLAQAWRGAPTLHAVAALLRRPHVAVVPLDEPTARAAGVLCGRRGTADVVDASVALCALARGTAVVTSDPDDIAHLAPSLSVFAV
jgi:predicted nucleic acid-binding protein